MKRKHLNTYLNDHLAGAVTALDLLKHLVADEAPRLSGRNYARLADRARDQRQRLEPVRLEAARDALAG